jgi:hypothetical protein
MDLLFTGTDTLFLNQYPPGVFFKIKVFVFRLLVRVLDWWFIERNLVVAENLRAELHLRKPVFVCRLPFEPVVYGKEKHNRYNILYYLPKTKHMDFNRWLYGMDVIDSLKRHFSCRINWIEVNGTQNMPEIYPIVDLYLRPTRHDGDPVMVKECQANGIPYFWSRDVEKMKRFITSKIGSI